MKTVILDTNFLIDLVKFKIDLDEIGNLVDEPYKLLVPNLVINELIKISSTKTKHSRGASLALEMVKLRDIDILACEKTSVDEAIVNTADKDTMVATNDRELRKRLKRLGIKTIYLRARKHLAIS
jgi:rRNA-processing protein FCF1